MDSHKWVLGRPGRNGRNNRRSMVRRENLRHPGGRSRSLTMNSNSDKVIDGGRANFRHACYGNRLAKRLGLSEECHE
jgi:hypothetical protein